MTKLEIKVEIANLRYELGEEMAKQNRQSSATRSYARVDSLKRKIANLRDKLPMIIRY